jgi:tetratricopeptide (TPR) repeat protein
VEANNPDEAIKIYNALLSRPDLSRPEKRLTLFNLGVIHHHKAESTTALSYWKEAATLPIGEKEPLLDAEEMELAAAAFMNLGSHYVLAEETEKGLGFLQAAADLDPDDGEIRYNLAATLGSMGRHDEAIKEFEAAEERGIEMAREVIEKIKQGMAENGNSGKK